MLQHLLRQSILTVAAGCQPKLEGLMQQLIRQASFLKQMGFFDTSLQLLSQQATSNGGQRQRWQQQMYDCVSVASAEVTMLCL